MKIVLLANPNIAHTRRYILGLLELGHQVALIGDHRPQVDLPDGVTVVDLSARLNVRKLRYLVWGERMPRLVRSLQGELLHALSASGPAWLGARANFHPFIITATGSDLLLLGERSGLHQRLTRNALREADFIFTLSNQLLAKALELGVKPERIAVNFWGIDTDTFHPADRPTLMDGALPGSATPQVINLRAVREIYNPLLFAQAIPLILAEEPSTTFTIFTYNADPLLLSNFESLIRASSSQERVKYVPSLSSDGEIAERLRQADVAVSIAASDGTPISVLESMACGDALVLGDIPTLHDWIRDEVNGLFVPLGDAQALAQAVLRLLHDASLRQRLGQAAAQAARQRASRQAQFAQIEQVYQGVSEK